MGLCLGTAASQRECKHCYCLAAEGREGTGVHRGLWFCRGCWLEWQQGGVPVNIDECRNVDVLRNEIIRLRRELVSAETLRVSTPCTDVVHWSEMQQASWEMRWRYWESWCPCCKRPLCVSTHPAPPDDELRRLLVQSEDLSVSRLAYVSALWGAGAGYALGALVLGCSLRRRGTPQNIDLVLLHTDDVPQSTLDLLQEVWILKPVDYVMAHPSLFACKGTRFDAVFTKLHVFSLSEYDKVVMLDLDLAIMHCPDALFGLPAPAALHRSLYGNCHGARIDGRNFFAPAYVDPDSQVYEWGQAGGINAGVMVLAPSTKMHRQVLHEVSTAIHPERIPGAGPEQDYLSRLFAPDWTHIGVAYNYQLHRVYHSIEEAARRALEQSPMDQDYSPERLTVHLQDICVVHFSGSVKMWDRDYVNVDKETDDVFAERLLQGDSPWHYKFWFEKGGEAKDYEAIGWRPLNDSWEPAQESHEDEGRKPPGRTVPMDAWLDHLRSTARMATVAWRTDLLALQEQFVSLPPLAELLNRLQEPDWPADATYSRRQRVEYYWDRGNQWFPAVVSAAHADGTFSLEFDTPGAWPTDARHVRKSMLRERLEDSATR